MGKVSHRICLPNNGTHTYFIAGDWHSYHLNIPTYKILGLMASQVENKTLVINGDFLDTIYGFLKDEKFLFWRKQTHGADEFFLS